MASKVWARLGGSEDYPRGPAPASMGRIDGDSLAAALIITTVGKTKPHPGDDPGEASHLVPFTKRPSCANFLGILDLGQKKAPFKLFRGSFLIF